ncbi:MAG: type II toxin-antitoxin system HicA family toxin [Bryobacteraceae bacterium]|jgi:predicted RNA binding protein YcfA (HicA-like mRNA interferase family)
MGSHSKKGDHRVFRHRDGRITVVSGKLGEDVRPGTYKAILRQTNIKEEPE